ncbi:hypothetical protein [Actinocorallia aurea]
MEVPDPWDFEVFCSLLQKRRGRPLRVLATLPTGVGSPYGLYISTDGADHVFTVEGSTRYHREHIALHEIGHLLFEHKDSGMGVEELASLLLPSLDPALVRKVLGRSAYSDHQEEQAEYFASLVLARVRERRMAAPIRDRVAAEVLTRLESTWGRSPWRERELS